MIRDSNIEILDVDQKNPKKKNSKKNLNSLQVVLFAFFTLITIAVLISIIIYFVYYYPYEDYYHGCDEAHETYDIHKDSILGKYKKFSVAVDSPFCARVGKEIILKNGSAVDAAIAAGLCNGIAHSQSSGIGGGHFMVIYLKEEKKTYVIDAREQAPMNSDTLMFVNNNSSFFGGLSTGVPGEIYGFWEAHKIAGKLPWKDLFEPVIRMCLEGFPVSEALAGAIKGSEKFIRKDPGLNKVFINSANNKIFKEKDLIRMPDLAKTLKIISEQNITAFYNGTLAKIMVDEINQNGGNVTLEDFNNYRALVKKPIVVNLDDEYQIFTVPPPSSGVLVAFIMKLMKSMGLDKNVLKDKKTEVVFYHRLIESMKHAYAKRTYLGDEKFENVTDFVEMLTTDKLINEIKVNISDSRTFPPEYYGPAADVKDNGTTHISVISDGDAVSLTSSINVFFGGKYAGATTGIIYNNQMDDFSTPNETNYYGLKPSKANFIKPGKRPMSSMSPIIITDKSGEVRLVLGASGGSKILSAVAQVALKNLWLNKNIKEAIDDRRVHHQLFPIFALFEYKFPIEIKRSLHKKGHLIKCFASGGSVVQGIARVSDGSLETNCDARKGGLPDGE